MPDVDTNKAMEDMIRWNMSMQKGNLGLTNVSKDDAALFLLDAEIDASNATSIGESINTRVTDNIMNNAVIHGSKPPSQQPQNSNTLGAQNRSTHRSTIQSDGASANAVSTLEVPDIFTKGSLFQFDSINADESSQNVEVDPTINSTEDEHRQDSKEITDAQAQRLAAIEQSCRDSYMEAYKRVMKGRSNMGPKHPVSRKKKIKKQRIKTSERKLPVTEITQQQRKLQQAITEDDEEKKDIVEKKKFGAQRNRRLEGVQKKQGMLELSSQKMDSDLSISSSDSARDLYFAGREAPVLLKPTTVTAAIEKDTAESVIVQNINTVQKEEADTKVYSVQPLTQKTSDRRQQHFSKKNAQENVHTEITNDDEVNQLRQFSIIQPPERFHEVVAGKEIPAQQIPAEPDTININLVHQNTRPEANSIHNTLVVPVEANVPDKVTTTELIESINLQETIVDDIRVIGVENIRKSQRRLRRSMTAIDQAIQRNMSMINSETKSSNLLNIIPNSREHTSDPSRFPISASPREVPVEFRAQDHHNDTIRSINDTLTMEDLQPTHTGGRIVLTPQQQQQQQIEISKSSEHNDTNTTSDISTPFTVVDTSADFMDHTDLYRQSGSVSTKIVTNESNVSGLNDEPVEPSRKKQKRIDIGHLNHSIIDNYFKKELYNEVYGSVKLRNFLTSGTGLTLEEIRRKYGVPVMNAKKVRDVKLENIPVDHSLLPRDRTTGRVIVPELDKSIGEGVVYIYPSGGEPCITSVKVAFIPNKPPRPKRQQPTGRGANLDDPQLFKNKQTERIQRIIENNNLTINNDKFLHSNKHGQQFVDIFKSFSELSFEYFHGLQMAKIIEDRHDGKRSNGTMLWHLYGYSQSDRITSAGYCITQLSQGWAKFFLDGNGSAKEGELTEYTTCQYESVTIPRGIKFFLSTSLVTECYFLCCIVNI